MAQEREIAARLTSLNELLEIVAAIRAMAASQMQQALQSLEAIRGYSDVVREASSDAATLLPSDVAVEPAPPPRKSGLVVFCAEHGLCGGFNEGPLRMVELAMAQSCLLYTSDAANGDSLRRSYRRGTPCGGGSLSHVQRAPNRRR